MRPRLTGPALLLLIVAIFFRHLVPAENVLYLRDLALEVLPLRGHVTRMVADGTAPWWTPLVFGGAPTVAMVHGLFYPPTAVFFVLPAQWALKVFVVGHDLLAGLGLWMLLRALALPPAAALVGAVTYMLSGYVLSLGNLVNLLIGAAWLPWALLCLQRAVEASGPIRVRWALLTGAVLGLQGLADIQSVYQTAWVLALWIVLSGRIGWVARARRGIAVLAAAGVIGALLAAGHLLPLAEYYGRSVRASGLAAEEAFVWAYNPPRLLELLAPGIWGDLIQGPYWGWMFDKGPAAPSPLLLGAYLGIAPLVLAALAVILRGRRRWVGFCLALAALSLLLALGGSTPVYPALHRHLPFFDRFRYPVKWLLPFTFSLAVLAGIGAAALGARRPADRQPTRVVLAAGALALAALVGALLVLREHPDAVTALLARQVTLPSAELSALSERIHVETVLQGFMAAAWLGATLVAVWAVSLSGFPPGLAQGAMLTLVLADLLLHNGALVPVAPRRLVEAEVPLARVLQGEPGLFRALHLDTGERQHQVLERARSPFAPSIVAWYRSMLVPNTGMEFELAEFGGANPARLSDYQDVRRLAIGREIHPRLLGAWNVRFLIVPYADLEHPALERVTVPGGDPGVRLYRNRFAMPRAYWVGRARWYGDRGRLLEALARLDPKREVLLDGPDQEDPDGEAWAADGTAETTSYKANVVVVRVQAPAPGYAVLADTYYPGWRVTVDGATAPLLRANYSMRAVAVPAGLHDVRFHYEPRLLYAGAGVSIATALLLAGALMRRSSAPPEPAAPGAPDASTALVKDPW